MVQLTKELCWTAFTRARLDTICVRVRMNEWYIPSLRNRSNKYQRCTYMYTHRKQAKTGSNIICTCVHAWWTCTYTQDQEVLTEGSRVVVLMKCLAGVSLVIGESQITMGFSLLPVKSLLSVSTSSISLDLFILASLYTPTFPTRPYGHVALACGELELIRF